MTGKTDADVAHIAGNASAQVKRVLSDTQTYFGNLIPGKVQGAIFCEGIGRRLKVTEVSISPKAAESEQLEGKVVAELDVTEDMLSIRASVHGGCIAALIDMCSSLALYALMLSNGDREYFSVSQTMNLMFHSPAELGDKLKLVNTTIAVGSLAHSAETQIWNVTKHQLVASGSQIKMVPSAAVARL